jgi:beta-barrel assembly-enhancing protease
MSYGPDEGRGRSGINPRVAIAVVIAIVAVGVYFSRMQVNPVTGKKQAIALTVDQEKALGLQAAPEMAQQMGGRVEPAQSRAAKIVEEVGRRIVDRSDAAKSAYVENFRFSLLADAETVNAFALPGGPVFITRGLYDKLDTEAQLAAVLGHEIGHVVGRHAAEHMAKSELGQAFAVAVGIGASDEGNRGRDAAMAAQMANQVAQLKFGRGDESEADQLGLQYMAQAGYDPSAMLDLMRILQEVAKGSRQPEFLSSHPLPETRLQAIKDTLAKDYPNGIPSNLSAGRSLRGTDQGN